jgi:hypothetical protein
MSLDNHISAIQQDILVTEELLNAYSSWDANKNLMKKRVLNTGRYRRRIERLLHDDLFYERRYMPEIRQLMNTYDSNLGILLCILEND